MRGMDDNSVDMVLTDPPYGIGFSKKVKGGGDVLAKNKIYEPLGWDDKIPAREVFVEILRVSKNQIIFGGNYFIEYLHNTPCFIVWDKLNGDNFFADCELAWTSFKTSVRKIEYRWQGMLQQNMKDKEKRYHPTQKPVDLFAIILEKYAEKTDVIMDCFSGVGTTGIACERLGIKDYILVEKEKKYFDIGKNRIEAEQAQLKLF